MQPAPATPDTGQGSDEVGRGAVRVGVVDQRVRVGALGLAFVFLLVMLATAMLRATGDGDVGNDAATMPANAATPTDEPLAQLGVAPGNVPADPITPSPATPNPAPAAPVAAPPAPPRR